MGPRVPAGPRFGPRPLPAEDLVAYLSAGPATGRFRHRAVLTMRGPAAEVADVVPPTLGTVEPVDDTSCLLRIGSDRLDHLAVWVAAFGFDFVVHEPEELVERLRTLTGRLQRSVADRDRGRGPSLRVRP